MSVGVRRPESQLAQLGSLYPFQSEGEEDRDRQMVEDVSFPGPVSFGARDFPLTARCCCWHCLLGAAGPCPVAVEKFVILSLLIFGVCY